MKRVFRWNGNSWKSIPIATACLQVMAVPSKTDTQAVRTVGILQEVAWALEYRNFLIFGHFSYWITDLKAAALCRKRKEAKTYEKNSDGYRVFTSHCNQHSRQLYKE